MKMKKSVLLGSLFILAVAAGAAAWSCFNSSCVNDGVNCATAACSGATCTPSGGVGTLSVAVTTDGMCSSETSTCTSTSCARADFLTAQATLTYTGCTTPGCVNSARQVLVCDGWVDCNGSAVCAGCQVLNIVPGSAPTVLGVAQCQPNAAGTYQYQIKATDVQGTSCTTCSNPNSCTNGCAGNCAGAQAASCCITLP